MDKVTRTLMTVVIATVVGIALLLTVAGASAGAAFLLTEDRTQPEGSLTRLFKASPEASIFPARSNLWQASMLVTQDDDGNSRFSLSGELNEVNEETIVVAQQVVQITNATLDRKALQVGSYVVVQGRVSADGMLVAEVVYPTNALETGISCAFTGQVEYIDDRKLVVNGKTMIIVDATVMAKDIRVGDRVAVECLKLVNGEIIATRVKWLEDEERRQFEFQGENKVTICHIPPGNPANRHTITIGESAVETHVSNHGDTLGPCP